MPILKDKNSRTLVIQNKTNKIWFQIDCFDGTKGAVGAAILKEDPDVVVVKCGEKKFHTTAGELCGRKIIFNGNGANPSGDNVKIYHKIWEEGGNMIEYTFPDDYEGEPAFDSNKQIPAYLFKVKIEC
jgi:hypothetical protein